MLTDKMSVLFTLYNCVSHIIAYNIIIFIVYIYRVMKTIRVADKKKKVVSKIT